MNFLLSISTRNLWILFILLISLTAWRSQGYFHVDEHFQLLEYAQFKIDGQDKENLAWEYQAHLRPGLQISIAAALIQIAHFFEIKNPFTIAFLLRLLSGFLALFAISCLSKALFKDSQDTQRLFILLAGLLWFMPYQMVRFSSENWSALLIIFALCNTLNNKSLIGVGLLSGLAFSLRYQSAFFIAGLGLWLLLVRKDSLKSILLMVLGFIISLVPALLSDFWLYGEWTFPAYQYFYVNLIEGKAAEFGTEPFYYYFIKISESGILPIGLLILAAYAYFVFHFRKNIVTWVSLPFFVLHCLIAHKELRFLFPLVYFIPVVLVMVYQHIQIKSNPLFRKFVYACVLINLVLLPFSSFKASNPRISLLKHLYQQDLQAACYRENPYFDVHWYRFYFPEKFDPKALPVFHQAAEAKHLSQVIIPRFKTTDSLQGRYVYKQVPSWVEHLNYFQWLDRSNTWCIIHVEK